MPEATLCYLFRDGKVLLQQKAPGLFGEGKWNGPGGKVEQGESPEEATAREVLEETGVEVKNLEHVATLYFIRKELGWELKTHVYKTEKFEGEPKDGKEGILRWFKPEDVPYKQMWADDEIWMPHMFKGKKLIGRFYFTSDFSSMPKHEIEML